MRTLGHLYLTASLMQFFIGFGVSLDLLDLILREKSQIIRKQPYATFESLSIAKGHVHLRLGTRV